MATKSQPKKRESTKENTAKQNSPGLVILQWLSYAFWAWLAGGLIWLVNLIFATSLVDANTSDAIPYALAASLVLLPTAFIIDRIYRKREPINKHGATMVIMVIHAVLYALIAIGTLIGAVFIALNMFINDSLTFDNRESVALITTLFAALIFGFILLRVLNPFKAKLFGKIFGYAMLLIAGALIVFGFAGPAMSAFNLRDDRLIEAELGTLSSAIASYVNKNDTLPKTLNDLNLRSNSAKTLVDKNLVTFKSDGTVTIPADKQNDRDSYVQHRYQLCVTYKQASRVTDEYYPRGGESYPATITTDDGYQTYPETYNHEAGNVCYKLQTYNTKDLPIGL